MIFWYDFLKTKKTEKQKFKTSVVYNKGMHIKAKNGIFVYFSLELNTYKKV